MQQQKSVYEFTSLNLFKKKKKKIVHIIGKKLISLLHIYPLYLLYFLIYSPKSFCICKFTFCICFFFEKNKVCSKLIDIYVYLMVLRNFQLSSILLEICVILMINSSYKLDLKDELVINSQFIHFRKFILIMFLLDLC